MENFNTTTNANDAEFPQTGAAPNVDSAPGPTESSAPAPADPLAGAGVEEPSESSAAVATPAPSTIPAPVAASANSVASDSKDEAGAEGQVPAVPSKASEYNLPPTARKRVTEPDEGMTAAVLSASSPGRQYPRTRYQGARIFVVHSQNSPSNFQKTQY